MLLFIQNEEQHKQSLINFLIKGALDIEVQEDTYIAVDTKMKSCEVTLGTGLDDPCNEEEFFNVILFITSTEEEIADEMVWEILGKHQQLDEWMY